jgi:p-cumate 2,3-dioxygenase subunit beta
MSTPITRNDVEEFLYREAQMLDRWELDTWLALFTDDAHYHVPTIGTAPEVGPENTLFYIADDHTRLRERVIRLQKKGAHVEWPRSRTRHMVTNVLIDERGENELQVSAAFAVHRRRRRVRGQLPLPPGDHRRRSAHPREALDARHGCAAPARPHQHPSVITGVL